MSASGAEAPEPAPSTSTSVDEKQDDAPTGSAIDNSIWRNRDRLAKLGVDVISGNRDSLPMEMQVGSERISLVEGSGQSNAIQAKGNALLIEFESGVSLYTEAAYQDVWSLAKESEEGIHGYYVSFEGKWLDVSQVLPEEAFAQGKVWRFNKDAKNLTSAYDYIGTTAFAVDGLREGCLFVFAIREGNEFKAASIIDDGNLTASFYELNDNQGFQLISTEDSNPLPEICYVSLKNSVFTSLPEKARILWVTGDESYLLFCDYDKLQASKPDILQEFLKRAGDHPLEALFRDKKGNTVDLINDVVLKAANEISRGLSENASWSRERTNLLRMDLFLINDNDRKIWVYAEKDTSVIKATLDNRRSS